MTAPTDKDVDYRGAPAARTYEAAVAADRVDWCYAELDDVYRNMAFTGYPIERCHFVKGDVLETLPSAQPAQIAILHLDTDWYESTRHELEHCFPRLSPGGVLIIDDYGHWQGCRKAVDEYFAGTSQFFCALDYSARLTVKGGAAVGWAANGASGSSS
jgi:predicted O-methyltransferase YrrM